MAQRTAAAAEKKIGVESTAFQQGAAIPEKHTGDGDDVSPPLSWSEGPAGTVTYALVMDDPDAPMGTWLHWTIWNLKTTKLEEGASKRPPAGSAQGQNSWKRTGYGGPKPPSGTHRYFFRVYALDASLDLKEGADRDALETAIRGHVLAQGELMGRYSAR